MSTFHKSPHKQAAQMIDTINNLKVSSSIAQRLNDLPKQSQITQYYNVNNNKSSFQNSLENFSSHYKTIGSPQNNLRLFPSFDTSNGKSPKSQNGNIGNHQNENNYENQGNPDDHGDLFLVTRPSNLKQSHVQQSLQKAFNLNRNTQKRIPFKSTKNETNPNSTSFVILPGQQGQRKSYNFYSPGYEQYYVKQDKNFWAQTFDKFYEKKGTLQNLQFPSFQENNSFRDKEKVRFSQERIIKKRSEDEEERLAKRINNEQENGSKSDKRKENIVGGNLIMNFFKEKDGKIVYALLVVVILLVGVRVVFGG